MYIHLFMQYSSLLHIATLDCIKHALLDEGLPTGFRVHQPKRCTIQSFKGFVVPWANTWIGIRNPHVFFSNTYSHHRCPYYIWWIYHWEKKPNHRLNKPGGCTHQASISAFASINSLILLGRSGSPCVQKKTLDSPWWICQREDALLSHQQVR